MEKESVKRGMRFLVLWEMVLLLDFSLVSMDWIPVLGIGVLLRNAIRLCFGKDV